MEGRGEGEDRRGRGPASSSSTSGRKGEMGVGGQTCQQRERREG